MTALALWPFVGVAVVMAVTVAVGLLLFVVACLDLYDFHSEDT